MVFLFFLLFLYSMNVPFETERIFGDSFEVNGFKVSDRVFTLKLPPSIVWTGRSTYKSGDKVRLITPISCELLGTHPINSDYICVVKADIPIDLNTVYGIKKEYVEMLNNENEPL